MPITTSIKRNPTINFLMNEGYAVKGPFYHCPEDDGFHFNIYSKNNKWVGSLNYDPSDAVLNENISVHYEANISEDLNFQIGATSITINTQQIQESLRFRDFLTKNNMSYKEYNSSDKLRKIAKFVRSINTSELEELANQIDRK